MLEENSDAVTVTFGLGEEVPGDAQFFGYGVDYYDVSGGDGKRLGVRFGEDGARALIFEWSSATQANAGSIAFIEDALVIVYPDASIGVDQIGSIHAFAHVNGDDVQTDLQVTVLRQ